MYTITYDLAKAIQQDRLSRSLEELERRRIQKTTEPVPQPVTREATVVELVFPSACETDQIGA